MKTASIRQRFGVTVLTRIVGLVAGIATAGIVPRSLGPVNYGNFQFLHSAFLEFKNLLGLGVSDAFFTLTSKDEKSGAVVVVFCIWELIQTLLLFSFIAFTVLLSISGEFWPDQDPKLIYSVAGIVVFQVLQARVSSFADAKALTIPAQLIKLAANLLQVVLIVLLFLRHELNLTAYVVVNYIVSLAGVSCLLVYLIRKRHSFLCYDWSYDKACEIIRYFISYCSPLVVCTLAGCGFGYFQRWFLQLVGGSVEQGVYSLSFNWSQIILLFTSSMLPIFWREISCSFGKSDYQRIREIFGKFIRLLYCLAAYFAVFICIQAKFLIVNLAGDSFEGAILPFAIMAFYPVHQVYGQLCGSLFLATERTRQYRNIKLVIVVLGIAATYFLLAPSTFSIPGAGLGAIGLSIQIVVTQFIAVNILLFYNCRFLGTSFSQLFGHQLMVILGCISFAFVAQVLSEYILLAVSLNGDWLAPSTFLISGCLYSMFTGGILLWCPSIAGIDRHELTQAVAKLKSKFS